MIALIIINIITSIIVNVNEFVFILVMNSISIAIISIYVLYFLTHRNYHLHQF